VQSGGLAEFFLVCRTLEVYAFMLDEQQQENLVVSCVEFSPSKSGSNPTPCTLVEHGAFPPHWYGIDDLDSYE
jgi:hypothetical protein